MARRVLLWGISLVLLAVFAFAPVAGGLATRTEGPSFLVVDDDPPPADGW